MVDSLTQNALDASRIADALALIRERHRRGRQRDPDKFNWSVTRLIQLEGDLAGAIRSYSKAQIQNTALDLGALALEILLDLPEDANDPR